MTSEDCSHWTVSFARDQPRANTMLPTRQKSSRKITMNLMIIFLYTAITLAVLLLLGGIFLFDRNLALRQGASNFAAQNATSIVTMQDGTDLRGVHVNNEDKDQRGYASPDEVPDCPSSPCKEDENMVGICPGNLKNFDAEDVKSCALACCASDSCITWQFRRDVGCRHGADVRIGMEKDGTPAWCSSNPPRRWAGQRLQTLKNGKIVKEQRSLACGTDTWNPSEEEGQCFGLGSKRTESSGSPEECMAACCSNDQCGAWQWHQDEGCFYGKQMHSCAKSDDPVVFQPFVGRRKFQASRTYVDSAGKPWKQVLTSRTS